METVQATIERKLPAIKRWLLNQSPQTIHILDLLRMFNLDDACATPLAVRLANSKLPLKVSCVGGAGPFNHMIEIY